MNIEKLRNSDTREFKNYKIACEFLEESMKTGNSKKSQLKEWERYFKYHKDGNKFVIDEIYCEVKDKEDGRANGNNSIYGKYIQKLILDLLSQDENEGKVFLSCNQLLRKLQMVSVNYSKGRNNIPKLSEILKVDEDIVQDVFEYTHNKLKNALETSLNVLAKQSWIEWHKKKTVCIKRVVPYLNDLGEIRLDEDGMPMFDIITNYREATIEEIQEILKYEGLLLDEMECQDKRELLIKGRLNEFRAKINKKLKENCNIEFYYDSYEIISHKDTLVERLGRFEKTDTFNELNLVILDNTYKSIETKHKNSCKKLSTDNTVLEGSVYELRADEKYVCTSKSIVDKIIPRKARKINALWEES